MLRRFTQRLHRRFLHTVPQNRLVRTQSVTITDPNARFPAVCTGGLSYRHNIFGLDFHDIHVVELQKHIWAEDSFLPNNPARTLHDTPFAVLSHLAQRMPRVLRDGTPGLLALNRFRSSVIREIAEIQENQDIHSDFMTLLHQFRDAPNPNDAHLISNVAFWTQWVLRGWLFEGKLHGEPFTHPFVPAPLSTIAFAANAALGRLQIEFVYDDYTLKAAQFPSHRTEDDINYSDPDDIVDFIASIATPVGFNDVAGGMPEHNFRHNHSLMERQMRRAFRGWRKMQKHAQRNPQKVVEGWSDIATAAERAHRVFATMMTNTPPGSYPNIRLPIKGVRGGCGTVYPVEGVFYEGCGTDLPQVQFRHLGPGCYVDREFGQTGANSSMFKWLDVFVGVSQQRSAYDLTDEQKSQLVQVIKGEADPGGMGTNPIDSMQRAFDLLTRPAIHLAKLLDVEQEVRNSGFLKLDESSPAGDLWELAALQRLRLGYFVALHRCLHGRYVQKMIYGTHAVGGQSRAQGTGGSTPPFLKSFFDQTIGPTIALADTLLKSSQHTSSLLTSEMVEWIRRVKTRLSEEDEVMIAVQEKGLQLESEEKEAGHVTLS